MRGAGFVAMPRRADPDPHLPILAFARDATDAGLTDDQVRQRVRSGAWTWVARGAYLPHAREGLAGLNEHARRRVEHVHRAIAAADRNAGSVVAYESAALVHMLPVGVVPALVQLVVSPGKWTGRRSGINIRRLALSDDDVSLLRVPVTTPARTWVDLARRGSLADALMAGDAGLRYAAFSRDDLGRAMARSAGLPGMRRVARALPLIDGIRETPLESASFAYFVEHGIPLPACQVVIADGGRFLGRVDVLWDDPSRGVRLIGESDGAMKYGDRGEAYREKLREDQLRAAGYAVVRWGMADLRSADLAGRLRAALRLA
jgi:hypothetical protein